MSAQEKVETFTPGPWHFEWRHYKHQPPNRDNYAVWADPVVDGGGVVPVGEVYFKEAALLIAAAPELYEFIQKWLNGDYAPASVVDLRAHAEGLLAKARGETP